MTTESRGLRRAEFAVAAFGVTAFLLALLFVVDGLRFHNALLLHALSDVPHLQFHHGRELLLMALILFDSFALLHGGRSLWRGVAAHRRVAAALPVVGTREIGGRSVRVVPGAEPRAFCSGLLHPRVYVSAGALATLSAAELAAVVAHEGHHADRRDPLRILIARAIGDAYSLPALARREQALAELAADDAAVRRGGKAPLASALLAFPGGIAPERVDRLAGARPVGRGLARDGVRDRAGHRRAGAGDRGRAADPRPSDLLRAAGVRARVDRARDQRAGRRDGARVAGVAPGGVVPPPDRDSRRSAKRSPSDRAWRRRSRLPRPIA